MHIKINARTLHSVREVLQAAVDLGAEDLFGVDADPEELADWEDDMDRARRFLQVSLPHAPVTWHLVDQATANVLVPSIHAFDDALGSLFPDHHA